MNNLAEVYMWGTRIGILYLSSDKPYASFEYDADFIKGASNAGIEISPLMMPVSSRVYEFPDIANSFRGVPGLIADSLPDKFGNAVIRRWLSDMGRTESDFNVIDRLCYTGKRGMGALEYVPATGPDPSENELINVSLMVKFASDILNNRKGKRISGKEELTYAGLLKLGTSAGGARAKALIAWNEKTNEIRSGQIDAGNDYSYWLLKFDGVSKNGDHNIMDEPEYTRIEYAYYKMAVEAGIEMEECRLFRENGRCHFMTKRFDRVGMDKLHMQTLGAIAHIDYNVPGLCGYEQTAQYMKRIGITKTDIRQFFSRMVFNVMAVNQDDHVKNISFLMDRRGRWRLSPAYDVTFAYNENNVWLKAHQMTINGKTTDISLTDIRESGKKMGLSTKQIDDSIERVENAIKHWERFAAETEIREETYEGIRKVISADLIP